MPERSVAEQLDEAVQAMLDLPGAEATQSDAEIGPLLRIAAELRNLPREEFKARLKQDLQDKGERGISMAAAAEPIVDVRPTASPYLTLKNTAEAIEFYKRAFGAKENMRLVDPSGKIVHAEIQIGNATILMADESPQYGNFAPQTLGGSPVKMYLEVPDVDAFARHAIAEGAKVTRPIEDHFYGHRTGLLADPFGYAWMVSTRTEVLTLEQIQQRFEGFLKQMGGPKPKFELREGFTTVTAYLVTQNVPHLIQFLEKTFHAEETLRSGPGSQGGMHCEVRIGDSMLMIGGGGPGFAWKGEPRLGAFHVYVPDCDATYERALAAGALSLQGPADQEYGERTASVRDQAGNHWYIATFNGDDYKSEGAPTIQPYFHPVRGEPVINFLKNAFGATEMGRYTAPDGIIHHVTLKVGSSAVELGEAQGPYQPMKSRFMLYVPDVDAANRRALTAGATSMSEPADQPYGDRTGAVIDAFGNEWYIATPIGAKG